MTIEELEIIVNDQRNIIKKANEQIRELVQNYINSLPYKAGDKVLLVVQGSEVWIDSIYPQFDTLSGLYTGGVSIYINRAKKDGTRSKRSECLCCYKGGIEKV